MHRTFTGEHELPVVQPRPRVRRRVVENVLFALVAVFLLSSAVKRAHALRHQGDARVCVQAR
jgi:hypothetical protein